MLNFVLTVMEFALKMMPLGLQVMLKPHVDLLRDNKPLGRFWRGDIGGCPEGMPPSPHPPSGIHRIRPWPQVNYTKLMISYEKQ